MKQLITYALVFLTSWSFAQDLDYARNIIEKLCSAEMHGRGYYKNGDRKAATFIAGEFSNAGLEKFGDSYFQEYRFGINSIVGKVSVAVDEEELVPGKDFVISLASPSVNGTFPLYFEQEPGETLPPGHFIVTDMDVREIERARIGKAGKIAGFISTRPEEANMWWHVSNGQAVHDIPVIAIRKNKLPAGARYLKVKSRSKYIAEHKTSNIAGFVRGSAHPDSFFVFTAHYDHLGRMGKETLYAGANDNASGTAMLIDLARHYSLPENKPGYSMVFLALSGEEAGLLGSAWFAENPLFNLSKVSFLINLDMVGTGSDGITVVNGKVFRDDFDLLQQINEEEGFLKEVAIRGESCNSDHCPFYMKGVPAVFIYTRGKEFNEYHNLNDRADLLPLTEYEDLFRLLTTFVNKR
jgi:hypothetical protein